MSSLSRDFLTTIAREYGLSQEQEEAFVELYSGDGNERQVADKLHISHGALRNRMTGIYRKFSIGGKGPGKFRQLQIWLLEEQQRFGRAPKVSANADIETLVEVCRENIKPIIQGRCSTMRVLDMEQPIGIGEIYINVNILEKLTGRRRLDMADLLETFNPEDFDRFGLGQVAQKRVPGLEAVQRYNKLMVLGKPGAGKTTFLKYLAIQCIGGAFQATCVPIPITLKNFAETRDQPDLLTFILGMLTDVSRADFLAILQAGRALLLLDGLDEVREADSSRVLQDIQTVAERYPENQFVMTCRIAAQDYTFQQFTEVEVADFDEQQIAVFATKWFCPKHPTKSERFIAKIKENKRIQELGTNPLLLTLLCLIFEEKGKFKDSRAALYEEGIELLLERWDDSRDIERDLVYKKLSSKRKEDLLSQIAFTTFVKSEYFFKRKKLEKPVSDYIQNLPDIQTDSEALLVSSRKVLQSIEAQHGLLVARAQGIYSFSHLTFQEYFTARNVIFAASRNPKHLEQVLRELVVHITEKRWREVFLLTAEMLQAADYLLELMKSQVDTLLAEDEQLQKILTWGREKSDSVDVPYKFSAVRSFYFDLSLALSLALDLDHARILDRALSLALDLDLSLVRTLDLSLTRALVRALSLDRALDHDLSLALSLDLSLDLSLSFALSLALSLALDHTRTLTLSLDLSPDRSLSFDLALALDLARALDRTVALTSDSALKQAVRNLKEKLSDPGDDVAVFKQWWQSNGNTWVVELRAVMIEHRNIGHDWRLSIEQLKILGQYYEANQLLLDCLNSDCYVTRSVREKIEDTLLLPVSS